MNISVNKIANLVSRRTNTIVETVKNNTNNTLEFLDSEGDLLAFVHITKVMKPIFKNDTDRYMSGFTVKEVINPKNLVIV